MGKNILVQRRGRGTAVFRAPTYRRKAPATYPPVIAGELTGVLKGGVSEIVHDPGRGTPLAQLIFENGDRFYVPATEGLAWSKRSPEVEQRALRSETYCPSARSLKEHSCAI